MLFRGYSGNLYTLDFAGTIGVSICSETVNFFMQGWIAYFMIMSQQRSGDRFLVERNNPKSPIKTQTTSTKRTIATITTTRQHH